MSARPESIFRAEAVEHHERQRGRTAGPLDLGPRWLRRTYLVVMGTVLGALVFAAFASVNEYATGPAFVRLTGQVDVRAQSGGVVDEVLVRPGDHVRAGALLVRFHAAQEAVELERVQHEYDGQLLRMLRDPSDQIARQQLAQLRAERDAAHARMADRSLVAPGDGVVNDLRVHPGQSVAPGDRIASLITPASRYEVVALLPGSSRPQLRVGGALRIEMRGYRAAFQDVTIQSVSNAVIAPAEARRYLGEIVDAVHLDGPQTLVTARLPADRFEADGQLFELYEGMIATASARLRRRSLLATFAPFLRDRVTHGD